jgi:hypothetical protein
MTTNGVKPAGAPIVTVSGASVGGDGRTIQVSFSVNGNGSQVVSCHAVITDVADQSGDCGSITIPVPNFATAYDVYAYATTSTGSQGVSTHSSVTTGPPPQPIVVDESGTSGGSGSLSASGTANGNYGSAQECSTPNAFSIGHYPPYNCAQMGTGYRGNLFWFTGNNNCVSARRALSGATFTWTATIPVTGRWHVDVYVPYWTQYNLGAVYGVNSDAGAHEAQVNQQGEAGQWVTILGTSPFSGGRQYTVTLDGRDVADSFCHYQAADQVRWTWDGP